MRFEQTGANQFTLILRIATDATLTAPTTSSCRIFDKVTHALISTQSLTLDSTRLISSVISGTTVGFNVAYYSKSITLTNNANGYYVSSSHCCRSTNTNHTLGGSTVYTCDIPDPSIVGANSNPKFVDYPDSLILIIGYNNLLDFSCTDLDGDSLVYFIINPFNSTAGSGSKPYSLLTFKTAYTLSNILGPGASVTINSSTGIISAQCNQLRKYVIAVKCEEYRNGVKIGEVVRDIVIPSLNIPVTTSISEQKNVNSLVSVYPNPNNGNFNIDLSNSNFEKATLTLYDIQGKMILNQQLSNSNNTVVINTKPGMYIAKINVDNQEVIKRVVIQ